MIGGIVTGVLLNNLCFCKTKLLILGKIGRSTVNMYPINISKYYIQSRKKSGIGCTPQNAKERYSNYLEVAFSVILIVVSFLIS